MKLYIMRGALVNDIFADKIGAKYTVVLGGNELETGRVALKEMKTGESQEIHLDELENKLKEE